MTMSVAFKTLSLKHVSKAVKNGPERGCFACTVWTVFDDFWAVLDEFIGADPQWGTVDAKIKVPSVENPELTDVLPLKPGVGQIIAMHASHTARNSFLVLILTFPVHSPSFFFSLQIILLRLNCKPLQFPVCVREIK